MAGRWIALALGLGTLVIVGIFVGAVLRPPPAPRSSPGVGADVSAARVARTAARSGRWTVNAEVAPAGVNAVAIAVSIADAQGRAAGPSTRPTAALRMVDMAMVTQVVDLVLDTPGRWRGSGRLSMTGRWQLELDVDGGRIVLPFVNAP
jgi:hypothetical protein